MTAPHHLATVTQSFHHHSSTLLMTRDSDPLTTPSGEPVFKRHPRLNPERRKPKLVKPRTPRILDAYEAMQARAAGRLYDDDDVSPFTSEDDE